MFHLQLHDYTACECLHVSLVIQQFSFKTNHTSIIVITFTESKQQRQWLQSCTISPCCSIPEGCGVILFKGYLCSLLTLATGKGLKFYHLATESECGGTELSPIGNVLLKMEASQVIPGQSIVQWFLRRCELWNELKGCLMSTLKELMVFLKVLLCPAKNPCGV